MRVGLTIHTITERWVAPVLAVVFLAVAGIAGYVNGGRSEVYDTLLAAPEEWADAGFGYLVHVISPVRTARLLGDAWDLIRERRTRA